MTHIDKKENILKNYRCCICGRMSYRNDYCNLCYNLISEYNINEKNTYKLKNEKSIFYINKIYIYNNTQYLSLLSTDKNDNICYTYKTIEFINEIKNKNITAIKDIFTNTKSTKNKITEKETEDFRLKYETKYRTKDGHYVRSRAELIIDNWLYDNNILHEYEKRITDDNTNNHIFSDFYIKEKNLYIEYYGLNTNEYKNKIEYKRKIYEQNNLKCIELYEKDLENIEDVLEDKLLHNKKRS